MRYVVDVKAFFAFEVEAESAEHAAQVADAFVENVMTATCATVEGYNAGLPEDAIGRVVPSEICAAVDDGTTADEETSNG